MENKKSGSGKGVLIAIIIILTFMVLGLGTYIAYDKFLRSTETTKETPKNTEKEEDKSLIKDSKKEIVYEHPDYSPWVEAPYINIDSEDADKINKEIGDYYKKITKDQYEGLTYKYFVNDDIVSIIIKYTPGGDTKLYTVYNINQKTGKEVTNQELLNKKNLTKDSLIKKMKAIFLERVKTTEAYSMRIVSDPYTSVEQATNRNIETLSLDDTSIYLNDDGNLCVIEEEYQIAGAETGYYIMNIDKSSYEEY